MFKLNISGYFVTPQYHICCPRNTRFSMHIGKYRKLKLEIANYRGYNLSVPRKRELHQEEENMERMEIISDGSTVQGTMLPDALSVDVAEQKITEKKKKNKANPATELDEVSMSALMALLSSADSEEAPLVESERRLIKYLEEFAAQRGWRPEKGLVGDERKNAAMRNREMRFHSVSSLLKRYRAMKRQLTMLKDELVKRTNYESFSQLQEENLYNQNEFNNLAERLEIMSARDERKFQRSYAPYIVAGQRLELALEALEFALSVLKVENQNWYRLINHVYIEGEEHPTVRAAMEALNIGSIKTYYLWMNEGTKKLTEYMFGYSSNKQALASILVYFSQEDADSDFPDYL